MPSAESDRISIQSWTFRTYKKNEEVISAAKKCGASNIEIAYLHVKVGDPADCAKVIDLYKKRGIGLSSYGVCGIGSDEAKAAAAFEFARAAGLSTIVASLQPGGLEVAERLCEKYGKRIALHNHGRKDPGGSVWYLEDVFRRSSPNVGLCLDTAWMMDSGEDPVAVARKFAGRLYALHVKDFVFDRAGRGEDVVVGKGNLDLAGLIKFCREMGYGGYFTIEYEGDKDEPVPNTKRCVQAIRSAFKDAEK